MFLSELFEFPSALYLSEKIDDNSRLDVVEIARVVWRNFFSLCNKNKLAIRHKIRPLFKSTFSITSYDSQKNVGQRTYQYALLWLYMYKQNEINVKLVPFQMIQTKEN